MYTSLFSYQQTQALKYQNAINELAFQTGFDAEIVDRWCKELIQTSGLSPATAVQWLTTLWTMPDEYLLLEAIHPGFGELAQALRRVKPLDISGLEFIPSPD